MPVSIDYLIQIGGVLHFAILDASLSVSKVLAWRTELAPLSALARQLVWVHGAFIVFVIAGFGFLSLLFAEDLAGDSPLARALCGFISLFWLVRLSLKCLLFDARTYLDRVTKRWQSLTIRLRLSTPLARSGSATILDGCANLFPSALSC